MTSDQSLSTSIREVKSADDVETLWKGLECTAPSHFFFSWLWIGAWLRLVLPTTRVSLFECTRNGRAVALALLTVQEARRVKGWLRTAQVHVNESLESDYNMIIAYNGLFCEPGLEEAAWAAFLPALQQWSPAWDEIALSSLSDEDLGRLRTLRTRLRIQMRRSCPTWRVELTCVQATSDGLIGQFKRKSRQQIRQSLRAFGELGCLSLRAASTLAEAHTYFDRLERLHTARWNAEGERGTFANENWVRFHRDVIDEGFDAGHIQLLEITVGDEAIGYLYGHVYGDTVYMHQTGFITTESNRLRPGHVCHFEAMRYNAARGIRFYDLLPDFEDSYKGFFTAPGPPVHWIDLQRPRMRLRLERLARGMRDAAYAGKSEA